MATITLPVASLTGTRPEVFEIDQLSFARSITRQGKGARREWRRHLGQLRFPVIQSDECERWDAHRELYRADWHGKPMHGIRDRHRSEPLPWERELLPQADPWAMIDGPPPRLLFGDEQSAPGTDDR